MTSISICSYIGYLQFNETMAPTNVPNQAVRSDAQNSSPRQSADDSLTELVEQFAKTEKPRKLSSVKKAVHPRILDIKRTWRSTDSLCTVMENTKTSIVWKSTETTDKKAVVPSKLSEIKRTWRSADSLCSMMESTTLTRPTTTDSLSV